MNQKKKVAGQAVCRPKTKEVRRESQGQDFYPSWRFSGVDRNGPFAWPIGNDELQAEILEKLRSFDSMQWSKILGSDHHAIKTSQLSKSAKDRLKEIELDDLDEIYSFHIDGRRRMFGIRIGNVLKLLWWDPKHEVCPSFKKHT